ncbi:putative membrane protein [Acinetobacter sp. 263903-1]|uniref:Uncharacterized protein n=1 Tax=Acinetobacter radioresistens SK82 TaxID=596318 RepID=A0ABM9YRJ3_ACIRA|nr:hypothetical protein ACIRA0001_2549 [Acinetobacter radioresistens SK82]EXB33696.1 putative membrane protein [Acinetobacter sp. 1461402]EXB70085.1 putative membrane protein [Acinetobacter sp. 230853]EXB87163.1 putative membrane protein [Acinetobacter sp. 272263]EXF56768.1 putative membrane protein [Acinetobacter sp. 1294596]KCX35442.1 putative membrane protein [Acinetobacter sp. 263903-1]
MLMMGILIWLGPAVIGFLLMMLLFWLLVELAGWNKTPHR